LEEENEGRHEMSDTQPPSAGTRSKRKAQTALVQQQQRNRPFHTSRQRLRRSVFVIYDFHNEWGYDDDEEEGRYKLIDINLFRSDADVEFMRSCSPRMVETLLDSLTVPVQWHQTVADHWNKFMLSLYLYGYAYVMLYTDVYKLGTNFDDLYVLRDRFDDDMEELDIKLRKKGIRLPKYTSKFEDIVTPERGTSYVSYRVTVDPGERGFGLIKHAFRAMAEEVCEMDVVSGFGVYKNPAGEYPV
jgi:hypothetical protein